MQAKDYGQRPQEVATETTFGQSLQHKKPTAMHGDGGG